MAVPRPLLKLGSFGEPVRFLQQALNLGPSHLPRLVPDAQFGPKTQGRTMEFQRKKNLAPDGVVGPQTWPELDSLLALVPGASQLLAGNLDPRETQLRANILFQAQLALFTYGWGASEVQLDPASPRIAAAKCAIPGATNPRPRQGGASLQMIASFVGGAANHTAAVCPSISVQAEADWKKLPDPAARERLNKTDIGAWCGIFAMYVCKKAGMNVSWPYTIPTPSNQTDCDFFVFNDASQVRPGDIGLVNPGNHHFVVTEVAGDRVLSIDGNLCAPNPDELFKTFSVITRNRYLFATVKARGNFLRPNFARFA